MKKTIILILTFAGSVLLSSCTTAPICATSSVIPLQGKSVEENMGKTSGTDSAYSILGLYMIGRPDIDTAIDNALRKKGGDTLINVRCYQTDSYFFLFSITKVTVEGEAVKFASEAPAKGKTK
ncbi:MAG: hypothetical protein ACRCUT_01935 [Spirochaetota bacterium]